MIATENLKGRSGVYCAIHRDSLKCYVGSSRDMGGRRMDHMSQARAGSMMNFHRAIRKHGKDAFDFEVLEFCPVEQFPDRETFWIKFYQSAGLKGFNTAPNGYSMRPTYTASEATISRIREAAKNRPPTSEATKELLREAGKNMSQEAREKIRQFQLSRVISEETKARMKAAIKNRPPVSESTRLKISIANRNRSEEVRRKMSESQKNKAPISEETRARMAAATKLRHQMNPRTKETCAKLSQSLKGHTVSEETRAKLRAANLGRKQPPEVGQRISVANLGRKHSGKALENMRNSKTPEWRKRVSETMKKVCAERKAAKEQSL